MDPESLEGGGLMAVLRRASHRDLCEVVDSVNKALDSWIKWDARYEANERDLTKSPDFIAEHLCRAGGHSVVNWFRGNGPGYPAVVRDVCIAVGVASNGAYPDVVSVESALLKTLLQNAIKGMSAEAQANLLRAMADVAGRPISFDDVLSGGKLLALLAPLVLTAIAQQTIAKGVAAVAQLILGRLGASIAGPIGLIAGTAWLASDIAGPSLRGTIPAVAQIALLRQKFIWKEA